MIINQIERKHKTKQNKTNKRIDKRYENETINNLANYQTKLRCMSDGYAKIAMVIVVATILSYLLLEINFRKLIRL